MERNAHVAHLALGLEREGCFIRAAGIEAIVIRVSLRVHQIKIKILHAAGVELIFKARADIRLGLEEIRRQLVRQHIAAARIAAGETGLQRRLALALQIAVGCVEIIEARIQKRVDHFCRFCQVDLAVFHRQAHKDETEVLF